MSQEVKVAPEPELVEMVAKAIFTGILYGGDEEGWSNLSDEIEFPLNLTKAWYRSGAQDVLRAIENYDSVLSINGNSRVLGGTS